jgi:Ser/Thr protein kinase RdoA (MazF antagonist)
MHPLYRRLIEPQFRLFFQHKCTMAIYNLEEIFAQFDTGSSDESFVSAEPFGSGHINDTFRVSTSENRYFILQRINHEIFTRPVEVMDNIHRVTEHLKQKVISNGGDPMRETLTLLPTKGEKAWFTVNEGNYWRLYNFISDARSYEIGEDSCEGEHGQDHVKEAAAAFARFQRDVADIPAPRLHETIARFGDTTFRFEQFEDALKADVLNRAKDCKEEIEFALARRSDASTLTNMLANKQIPERVAHYDTKINNVLFDNKTGKGICVIDLDTVMPGLAIYDFGDAVRAATALAAEDERDLSKVGFSMEKFKLLAEGYLSEAKNFLTDTEIEHLAFAARLVSFTIGLRFLADHLAGDTYFKTQRANQNLDRCRTQFKTVADMEKQYDEMKAVVNEWCKK